MILIKFCNIFTFLNVDHRELNVTPTGEGVQDSEVRTRRCCCVRTFPVLLSVLLWTFFHPYTVNEGSCSVVYDESSLLGRYALLIGKQEAMFRRIVVFRPSWPA
jgi:hypothetical protein